MNVYEALRIYLDNSDLYGALTKDELNARTKLESTVIAYDTLEPDWSNAPEWSQWYAIDANGAATWSEEEPFFSSTGKFPENFWDMNGNYYIEREPVRLPLGIDWRLCKWQRPETTR